MIAGPRNPKVSLSDEQRPTQPSEVESVEEAIDLLARTADDRDGDRAFRLPLHPGVSTWLRNRLAWRAGRLVREDGTALE